MSGVKGTRWGHHKPCGTEAAYKRHLRHREVPCEACRQFVRYASRNAIRVRRAAERAEAQRQQARIDALLSEVIAVLAEALEVKDRSAGARPACWRCHRRICRCCGVQAARRAA